MLNKWIRAGQLMMDEMDLTDMAAVKMCLLSMGVLFGIGIPSKLKKPAALFSGILFLGTYLPLITQLLGCLARTEEEKE